MSVSISGDGSLTGIDQGLNVVGVVTASSGIVVAAGSTAAPSISPSGDSNTGIFFPSADTFSISTGGSERIRVGAAGSMNIGGTDTTYRLQVSGGASNSNNYAILHVRDSQTLSGAAGTGGIFLSSSPGTDYYIAKGYNGSTTSLKFGNANNGTDYLVVDQSGRVTTPLQPAFNAYINSSTHNNWTGTAYSKFPFSLTTLNIGSHYNTSTYRFTAPVSGNYFFYLCLSKLTDSNFSAGLRINDGNGWICVLESHQTTSPTQWVTHSASGIIGLSANDYVEAQVLNVNTTGSAFADGSATYPNTLWDVFGGYLVG